MTNQERGEIQCISMFLEYLITAFFYQLFPTSIITRAIFAPLFYLIRLGGISFLFHSVGSFHLILPSFRIFLTLLLPLHLAFESITITRSVKYYSGIAWSDSKWINRILRIVVVFFGTIIIAVCIYFIWDVKEDSIFIEVSLYCLIGYMSFLIIWVGFRHRQPVFVIMTVILLCFSLVSWRVFRTNSSAGRSAIPNNGGSSQGGINMTEKEQGRFRDLTYRLFTLVEQSIQNKQKQEPLTENIDLEGQFKTIGNDIKTIWGPKLLKLNSVKMWLKMITTVSRILIAIIAITSSTTEYKDPDQESEEMKTNPEQGHKSNKQILKILKKIEKRKEGKKKAGWFLFNAFFVLFFSYWLFNKHEKVSYMAQDPLVFILQFFLLIIFSTFHFFTRKKIIVDKDKKNK
ncbi:hypothetical protein M0812_20922 [Anaeramoeba flamelloides]|uniref:Uncharacterized protein n=1 Tax=Anaeramoeba flamelloides TaxID=1746091 RepID=A0AAV7YQD8_9EUKA|nr:hypothetical protein M0812_20922 [Anaeramoeba flamelloides]